VALALLLAPRVKSAASALICSTCGCCAVLATMPSTAYCCCCCCGGACPIADVVLSGATERAALPMLLAPLAGCMWPSYRLLQAPDWFKRLQLLQYLRLLRCGQFN
jgi:hypothetical protein